MNCVKYVSLYGPAANLVQQAKKKQFLSHLSTIHLRAIFDHIFTVAIIIIKSIRVSNYATFEYEVQLRKMYMILEDQQSDLHIVVFI